MARSPEGPPFKKIRRKGHVGQIPTCRLHGFEDPNLPYLRILGRSLPVPFMYSSYSLPNLWIRAISSHSIALIKKASFPCVRIPPGRNSW